MTNEVWRWVLGLIYIFTVATIWIAASFVVQSVVDGGVSPFLITYICNALFVIYIPLVEIGRFFEDNYGSLLFWRDQKSAHLQELADSEKAVLLGEVELGEKSDRTESSIGVEEEPNGQSEGGTDSEFEVVNLQVENMSSDHVEENRNADKELDAKGRWTRTRVAKASLAVAPFWFLAQLSFNLSLKYTTVTSNTILSTSSSLFTFLVSLAFLGEKFTCLKLFSVLFCMAGTIIVSLGDLQSKSDATANNPVLGDILSLLSAALYAVYITLIRKKLPDDDDEENGSVSMAQFLGFLGLLNVCIFLPVALILNFTKREPFSMLTWEQFGLVVGKGLLDNVLSDYLWAKAVLLTTTTVATAGLSIQVPLAAIVDTLTGKSPSLMNYIGAVAVMIGFAGINIPSDVFGGRSKKTTLELEVRNILPVDHNSILSENREPES